MLKIRRYTRSEDIRRKTRLRMLLNKLCDLSGNGLLTCQDTQIRDGHYRLPNGQGLLEKEAKADHLNVGLTI